ncbi:uncharacterized protein LOC132310180 [Cornus florida]|uniref:uncharacterized protein LOC132310180 n=1 Tax=Cornus florida TaxID=4283 RepID=UPI0028A09371|nr:uncharacterized protein LOC132310180 [Cornus florida]
MAAFARTKRVTDPLDNKVRDRIIGREPVYVSSGSEHSSQNDDESPCLSDLIHHFLEDDTAAHSPENESDSELDPSISDPTDVIDYLIYPTVSVCVDSFKNALEACVSRAIVALSSVNSNSNSNKSIFRRNVMAFLRDCGHNAAICKTRWESSGGLTAGGYEFIDVVTSESAVSRRRYFIDLDFAGEFEIARPTGAYERVLQALPRVFVGRSEELKQVVKVMSDAARRSLKSRGLHLPPWRKNRYMQNKWFGSYRRTTNVIPANSSSLSSPVEPTLVVKCRSVGFDVVKGRLLCPATTRT